MSDLVAIIALLVGIGVGDRKWLVVSGFTIFGFTSLGLLISDGVF